MAQVTYAQLITAIKAQSAGYLDSLTDTYDTLTENQQEMVDRLLNHVSTTVGGAVSASTIGATGDVTAAGLTTSGSTGVQVGGGYLMGYGAAAFASVTQGTSKSTTVAASAPTVEVTTHAASLNDATNVTFTITNTVVGDASQIMVNHVSGGTLGAYQVWAHSPVSGTSFKITIRNVSGGALGEALVIRASLFKGGSI